MQCYDPYLKMYSMKNIWDIDDLIVMHTYKSFLTVCKILLNEKISRKSLTLMRHETLIYGAQHHPNTHLLILKSVALFDTLLHVMLQKFQYYKTRIYLNT